MNNKLIIGIVIGFLVCHFFYKKRYSFKDNKIDDTIENAKNNLREFLSDEFSEKDYNIEKITNDIFSTKKTSILNFVGNSKKIF